MAEPYGGAEWIAQAIQAAIQAAMQQINWSQLMGYGYPAMYEPQAPTRNDMLNAIWENRPDIQAFYKQNWGDPAKAKGDLKNWRPEDAIENWLGMTGELTPEEKADPMAWAIAEGFITDYTAGGAVPTLARDEFEQAKEEWAATQLRLAGLDEEAIRQFNETMRFYRDQFDEDTREADRQYLRQIGLDETAIAQWDREQDRIEGMDAEYIRQANREFLRQQGLDIEGVRQFDVQHEFAKYQAQQEQANIEWEQLRLTGLDEQAAYQFQQTHLLAREQFEAGNVQWEAQFGLEQQYYGLAEQQLQLQQLQTMLGLTGPQDWPQYWAAGRAMPEAWGPQGEPVPAWARTLTEGGQYPAFGAAGQVPQGLYGGITPSQVSPQQWANLSPSEIQGLSGQVQTGGGWMPDWMQQMQASWPQGQATPISYFG